jgi:transcriptional regulator with XRE-family HTH domain
MDMDIRVFFARNLRRVRLERGYSQERLALEANIDRAYLSGLERGVRNPTVLLLGKLARVLEVSVSDLIANGSIFEAPVKNLPRGRHVRRADPSISKEKSLKKGPVNK